MLSIKRVQIVGLVITLCGCVSDRAGEAPATYLQPSGWQDVDATLSHKSFPDYAAAVKSEVSRFRLPVNPDQAAREIDMASPIEIPPAKQCSGQRGIAILVHGLSDTAFAMRDVAGVLADACYRARSILLPGHGTRAGDLLTTRLKHWSMTLQYLIDQAANEHEHVLLGGFSLGAVLTMTAALQPESPVDALIAFSPAYTLSSYRLARWAPWAHPFKPWIDRGLADDSMRYEAMPTRGVAETVRAMKTMHKTVAAQGSVKIPWLLVQSLDDAVTLPRDNIVFFERYARHDASRVINFFTREVPVSNSSTIHNVRANSDVMRVIGLTHLSVHTSPENVHYGFKGDYRNCGLTGPRDTNEVEQCTAADSVWYGLWSDTAPDGSASAMSTFNPEFNDLTRRMKDFLEKL